MATNAVIDLHKARNQRQRPKDAGAQIRGGGRWVDSQAVANKRSISNERTVVRAARALVLGAFAVALLWLGYVGAIAAAGHVEAVSAKLSAQRDVRFETREVVVRSGDTLWGIARDYGPAGVDVRQTVDWIRRNNGMSDATVYPGQVLKVPIKAAGMAP